jgi:hypothetical protein
VALLRAPDEQDTAPGEPSRAPFPNKALPLSWLCCNELVMGSGGSGQESD